MDQQLNKDEEYLDIILNAIRVCAGYKPKLGHEKKEGYSLQEFHELYRNDPFYNWVGLNSPLMYTAHKTAGGMTSIYRQIGIGCEVLFRKIIMDSLHLDENDVKWSYSVKREDGNTRMLSLDARIPVEKVPDIGAKTRIQKWISRCAEDLEIDSRIASALQGIVFEVRQGYKSKDSKRQNADIANAAAAYTQGFLPCAAIMSLQIDDAIVLRYRNEKWILLTGKEIGKSPYNSIYSFMREIIGYDLAAFFQRHTEKIKAVTHNVLTLLLAT